MELTKKAKKIWEKYFDQEEEHKDPFGEMMYKEEYGTQEKGGWEIDHIWPINAENGSTGSDTEDNMQPLSFGSNDEKGNKFKGKINDVNFAVENVGKSPNGDEVGRMKIKIKNVWYWADTGEEA